MKTLPKTIAVKENRRYHLQLATWLHERQIDCLLRSSQTAHRDISSAPAATTCTSREFSPVAGDVVLLPPAPGMHVANRPIYILILNKVRDAFLVAPFSRFATPAVQGEWKTGLRAKPLRVLCVWNTGLLSGKALSTGWPTTATNLTTVQRALEVHRHIQTGAPLEYVAAQALGPPLQHPMDPRHAYLEEESSLLKEHLSFMETCSEERSATFPYEQKPTPLLLAAEERTCYKTSRKSRKGPTTRPRGWRH